MRPVYESLSVVRISGYEHDVTERPTNGFYPGEPVWFGETYGYEDAEHSGIVWMAEASGDESSEFDVLIATADIDDLRDFAKEYDYQILEITPVTEPMQFGREHDCVEICRQRNGWVVLED